jgi:hypothetical protein
VPEDGIEPLNSGTAATQTTERSDEAETVSDDREERADPDGRAAFEAGDFGTVGGAIYAGRRCCR